MSRNTLDQIFWGVIVGFSVSVICVLLTSCVTPSVKHNTRTHGKAQ